MPDILHAAPKIRIIAQQFQLISFSSAVAKNAKHVLCTHQPEDLNSSQQCLLSVPLQFLQLAQLTFCFLAGKLKQETLSYESPSSNSPTCHTELNERSTSGMVQEVWRTLQFAARGNQLGFEGRTQADGCLVDQLQDLCMHEATNTYEHA
eukprot:1158320-Pelagomonas_calceolata.AAC.6